MLGAGSGGGVERQCLTAEEWGQGGQEGDCDRSGGSILLVLHCWFQIVRRSCGKENGTSFLSPSFTLPLAEFS